MVFTLVAVTYGRLALEDAYLALPSARDPASVLLLINRILTIIFSVAIAAIYVVRQPPAASRHDPVAFIAAMYASFLPLSLRPIAAGVGFADSSESEIQVFTSTLLIGLGAAFSIYAVAYLRLNFSILPAARTLTTTGPYRWIRHPVYLGEIVTAIGIGLLITNWLTFLLLLMFVGAQLLRTRFEEKILVDTIPEYAEYARRTRRIIPWVA